MMVTILGSGTCIPHPERASPGLVVEFDESTVLVDPSAGSLSRMERYGTSASRITHVLFSHYHPDHTGDLVPLLFAARVSQKHMPRKIQLIGPTGLAQLYSGLCEVYRDWIRLEDSRLNLVELEDHSLEFPDWSLQSLRVQHTATSQGFRFSDRSGSIFSYSGDSDYCDNLITLLKDADLAIVDAAYPSHLKVDGHLTPALAGKLAAKSQIQHLVLTHLYPECDGHDLIREARQSGFNGIVEVARDGRRYIL